MRTLKLTLAFTLLSVLACELQPDPIDLCGDLSETGPYDIKSLKLEIIESAYATENIETGTVVTKDSFFIRIRVDERIFLKISKKKREYFQLLRSAHACSPAPAYTDEIISEITITSNSDFSSNKKQGEDISELFQVYAADSIAADGANLPMSLPEYVGNHYRSGALLGLKLLEDPTISKSHIFTITYKHEDGELFTLKTPTATFK